LTLPPLAEDQVPTIMARLRAQDEQAREIAYLGHVRLALSIVGRYIAVMKSDRLADEMVSAAMEAVATGLAKIMAGEMEHDNLTGYLTAKIHSYVSDVIERQPTVSIPRRTVRHQIANDKEARKLSRVDFNSPAVLRAVTRREETDFEINEILDRAIQNDLDRQVIDLRRDGWTDEKIAEFLELSKTSVFVIRKGVETRFWELFYGS
jgi:hypothetical protein